MTKVRASRTSFLVWSFLASPVLGWSVAVFGAHGEGGAGKFVFLFIAFPALLSLAGAAVTRTDVRIAAPVAVGAGVMGGVTWFLTILWLAAHGVFD